MNKLENTQKKITGFEFIKSYPMLSRLPISSKQKDIIELILSYQHNGREFYMNYSDIAEIVYMKNSNVVKVNISALNKLGYISTVNTKNYNGKNGGSSTSIKVNEDYIIELITKTLTDTLNIVSNEVKVEEAIDTPIQVEEELKTEIVEDIKQKINESPSNNKKEALKEKFNEIFNETDNLKLVHLYKLAGTKLKYIVLKKQIEIIKGITKNDFETFYNRLQEIKPLIKN
jgi:hypothetical protein